MILGQRFHVLRIIKQALPIQRHLARIILTNASQAAASGPGHVRTPVRADKARLRVAPNEDAAIDYRNEAALGDKIHQVARQRPVHTTEEYVTVECGLVAGDVVEAVRNCFDRESGSRRVLPQYRAAGDAMRDLLDLQVPQVTAQVEAPRQSMWRRLMRRLTRGRVEGR